MELLYAREYTQGERAWERGYGPGAWSIFIKLILRVLQAVIFNGGYCGEEIIWIQVAVLHNDLATALDGSGRHSEAENHAHASLEIMTDSHATDTDIDMEYFARVYYNLGIILSHEGN